MFGISFTEIAVIALITLIFVGPQKLPSMLYTLGRWIRKLRELTTQVRAQTGIDEILRQEGFEGGLGELRSMLRGDIQIGRSTHPRQYEDPYAETYEYDQTREYPPEGVDAAGALPDDLVDEDEDDEVAAAAPEPQLTSHPAREPELGSHPAAEPDPDPPWKRDTDQAETGNPERTTDGDKDAEAASAPKSGPSA